jgi:hypothetical protein
MSTDTDMTNAAKKLDSSTIRHLILAAKIGNGEISYIATNVVQSAFRQGLLSEVPDLHYQNPLADQITAVVWELIIEGVYTPGVGL